MSQAAHNTSQPTSYTLTVSPQTSGTASEYHHNSLATIVQILKSITSQSSLPLPTIHKLDESLSLLPYHYILHSSPPKHSITLSEARNSNLLSPEGNAQIDLQLGLYLRQLHAIQNDWFGLPTLDSRGPVDPSYSWQESFTLFVETALIDLEAVSANVQGIKLPLESIRRYLSRAIGSFLFDDAEVPSLIWFTLSDEDIFISDPSGSAADALRVTYLPLPTHALWADPMLETLFIPPGPSKALVEAYTDGEGPLFVFARQRTKRLWYTLFLACVVLIQSTSSEANGKTNWAKEMINECTEKLKDAPCY